MGKDLGKYLIAMICLVMTLSLYAQDQYKIPLSEKHKEKIEKIKDPRKKLLKYRKYYSKDSIKYLRQLDKELKRKSDSVYALMRRLESKKQGVVDKLKKYKTVPGAENVELPAVTLPEGEVSPKLGKINVPNSDFSNIGGELMDRDLPISTNEISRKATNVLNSHITDARGMVENVKGEITPYQEYYNQYKDYLNNPDSLQAMVEKVAEKELKQTAEKMVENGKGLSEMNEFQKQKGLAEEIRNIPGKYKQEMEKYGDRERLVEEGKEKAIEFLTQHQDKIEGIQKKMSKLKRIYSKVENSNDLSTAVKRSSLKGRPVKERFFVATNFQVINLDPFSLDFSPSLGYMFNKKFIVGIGGAYRHTFGKYEPNQATIPEDQYAFNGFVQYDVIKGFFAFATYEQSNRELLDQNTEDSNSTWVPGFMAGIGKTVSVHPKINTMIMLLYNFLHEPGQSPYKSPWIFRTGLQFGKAK